MRGSPLWPVGIGGRSRLNASAGAMRTGSSKLSTGDPMPISRVSVERASVNAAACCEVAFCSACSASWLMSSRERAAAAADALP
jgi:hypothetical protein